MTKERSPFWNRWPILMILGLVAGTAVGYGVVEADFATYQIKNGYNYYPGPGTTDYDLMSHNGNGNVPSHKYDQRWRGKGTSDYPGATFARLVNGRYKHVHSVSSKACFYKTRITTEAGSNKKYGSMWKGLTLEPGMDASRSIGWEYDDFNASDKNLNVAQQMVVPFFNNAPCSAGMSASAMMEHYSDWEVH